MAELEGIMEEFNRIGHEKKETLRLIVYVIILGLLINSVVTSAALGNARYAIFFLLLSSVICLLTVIYLILTPSVISGEFPVFLILDTEQNAISLPLVMRIPEFLARMKRNLSVNLNVYIPQDENEYPFIINLYSAYQRIKEECELKPDISSADFQFILQQLINFLLIQRYLTTHRAPFWGREEIHDLGPMSARSRSYLPHCEVSLKQIAENTENIDPCVFHLYDSSAVLALPRGMKISLRRESADFQQILFSHDIATIAFSIAGGGFSDARLWKPRMLGNPQNLFAYRFDMKYEIKFPRNLKRVRMSSSDFRDLCYWVSDLVEDLREYIHCYDDETRWREHLLMDFERVTDDVISYSTRENEPATVIFAINPRRDWKKL